MEIDWIHFTPVSSAIGGILIGTAASVLILFNGRIAGISGILAGVLRAAQGDVAWRLLFIAGLLAAGVVMPILGFPLAPAGAGDGLEWPSGYTGLCALAGLLVGIGTRYGGGCTSGHGVCGIARGSLRSLVATLTFMATGFATVAILRHGLA